MFFSRLYPLTISFWSFKILSTPTSRTWVQTSVMLHSDKDGLFPLFSCLSSCLFEVSYNCGHCCKASLLPILLFGYLPLSFCIPCLLKSTAQYLPLSLSPLYLSSPPAPLRGFSFLACHLPRNPSLLPLVHYFLSCGPFWPPHHHHTGADKRRNKLKVKINIKKSCMQFDKPMLYLHWSVVQWGKA